MSLTDPRANLPRVQLVGDVDHPDFAGAVELLRAGAQFVRGPDVAPELIVIARSRPGTVSDQALRSLRSATPLAGVVSLVGTWCEGEIRTGRPWPTVERLYWYEFPSWWRRQVALRTAGCCPDWARWRDGEFVAAPIRDPQSAIGNQASGLIVLNSAVRDTADALADTLRDAGFVTVWQPRGRGMPFVRGAVAGIWDGGQLSECEAGCLASFCRKLTLHGAPVIARLDFPRRDRCEAAAGLGAATVLGKPWRNVDLVATIRDLVDGRTETRSFKTRAA